MNDYPRVLYHLAIERPRNKFGKIVEGAEPFHAGDLASPNYPIPIGLSKVQDLRGRYVGHGDSAHIVPVLHYKTMMVAVYYPDGREIDEEASRKEEERLALEGWVRHPDMLEEKYDE